MAKHVPAAPAQLPRLFRRLSVVPQIQTECWSSASSEPAPTTPSRIMPTDTLLALPSKPMAVMGMALPAHTRDDAAFETKKKKKNVFQHFQTFLLFLLRKKSKHGCRAVGTDPLR